MLSENWWHYVLMIKSIWDVIALLLVPLFIFLLTLMLFLSFLVNGREQSKEGV